MTKDDLVESVLKTGRVGTTKVAAREVVDTVFASMSDTLKNGDEVSIFGFGAFRVKQRAARKARNPISGETINVPAKKAVSFKAAKLLKDVVNTNGKRK